MLSRFGIEASQAAQYVIAFAIILVLVALFGLVLRRLTGGRLMLPGQDRARARQPRLGIVDIYDLDRQRQLILLRRDNVEHLLLIGGPNDVVIETNIVRVAGARVQAPAVEPALERPEPSLERPPEAPRPQVDAPNRPSLEAQLAARLGTVAGRPSHTSDVDEELAPVASATAMTPARVEPMLKPDAVTVKATPQQRMAHVEPSPRPAPPPPVEPPTRPEPPRAMASPPPRSNAPAPPRAAAPTPPPPSPFPAAPITTPEPPRPVPTPPAPPVPAAQPVQSAPRPGPEQRVPDAVILSDMAKQLEEALKRPVSPVASAPSPSPSPLPAAVEVPEPEDEDELLAPPPRPPESAPPPPPPPPPVQTPPRASEPPRPATEPVRPVAPPQPVAPPPVVAAPPPVAPPPPVQPPPAPPSPAAARPAPQEQPAPQTEPEAPQNRKVSDPFSVEEIEAEFARLLGRPLEKSDRN